MLAAIHRLSDHREASLGILLLGPAGHAVARVIKFYLIFGIWHTFLSFSTEIIVSKCEIGQLRQGANLFSHKPCQPVVPNSQFLYAAELQEGLWEGTNKHIVAHIKNLQISKVSNLRREAATKLVVHENNLIQIFHVPNASWYATSEVVEPKIHHRNRGVAQGVWNY